MGEIYLYLVHTHHHDHHLIMVFLPPPLHILSCKVRRMEYPSVSVSDFLPRTALLMTAFLLLINIYNSVVNETPNSDGKYQPSDCPAQFCAQRWLLWRSGVSAASVSSSGRSWRTPSYWAGTRWSSRAFSTVRASWWRRPALISRNLPGLLRRTKLGSLSRWRRIRNVSRLKHHRAHLFIRKKLRKTLRWSSRCSSWSFSASQSSMLFTGQDQGQDFLRMVSSQYFLFKKSVSQSGKLFILQCFESSYNFVKILSLSRVSSHHYNEISY